MLNFRMVSHVTPQELGSVLALRLEAVRDATDAVDAAFRRHERAVFSSSGASGGSPWVPLSAKYAARKRKLKPGRPILVFGGRLRSSFTSARHPQHVAKEYRIGETWSIVIGSVNPLAKYHYDGAGPLPRRDPMPHTSDQWKAYLTQIQRAFAPHVSRAVRALAALASKRRVVR